MINGLMVASRQILFDEMISCFRDSNNNIHYVNSIEAALEYLESDAPDFIAISEDDADKILEMLLSITKHEILKEIPVLCFIPRISWEVRSGLWEAGAFDVIQLPILKEELTKYLKGIESLFSDGSSEIGEGLQGSLQEINLLDLIHIFEEGKKSGELKIISGVKTGKLYFYNGKLYQAELKDASGVTAVVEMILWNRGEFSMQFSTDKIEQKIELENAQIILEGLEALNEKAELQKQLPPWNTKLLISPAIFLNDVKPDIYNYLKFFQGGKTIDQFMDNFETKVMMLMDKLLLMIAEKQLVTQEEFDNYTSEYEQEVNKSGIIKKIFGREKAGKKKSKKKKSAGAGTDEELKPKESVFLLDPSEVKLFIDKIRQL